MLEGDTGKRLDRITAVACDRESSKGHSPRFRDLRLFPVPVPQALCRLVQYFQCSMDEPAPAGCH